MSTTRVLPSATSPLRPRRVQPLSAVTETPWANGAGSTRVIADDPAGWRISVATVRDGSTFSELPGVDRVHLPLEPGSIILIGPGGQLDIGQDGAYPFDGSLPVTAVVADGEADALNLMSAHGGPSIAYRSLHVTGPYVSDDPAVVCAIVRSGWLATSDGRTVRPPSVIPARYHVEAEAAEILELFVETVTPNTPPRTPPNTPTSTPNTPGALA